VHPADGACGRSPLNKELGSGGKGVVRKAEETSLPRAAAIRMMRGFGISSAGIAAGGGRQRPIGGREVAGCRIARHGAEVAGHTAQESGCF
jgi:hypothetical protein